MTEKRFYYAHGIIFDAHKDNHINKIGTINDLDIGLRLVNWLNELNDENEQLKKEKESWKSSACNNSSFNSILLHELDIAQEQGYKLSDPFKKLMMEKND